MSQVDQSTMTEPQSECRRCNCNVTAKYLLQFFSSLLLPLMLEVFTIVITVQQQRVATEQRIQDLNNSAQQRAEDRQVAIDQRIQDKLIAKEQREQDEQRRLQDLKIAEAKRDQDNELAEKERGLLEKQRAHELAVEAVRYEKEHEKYHDPLLVTYMNDIGALFLNSNGSLMINPTVGILVRSKTLTIARQLDPSRNIQIIRFLYEAGQLTTGQNPLDLSGANFNNIDLSTTTRYLPMHRLCLSGAHLNNASFDGLDLSYANFSNAHLRDASFVDTYLTHVDFSQAILMEADFEQSKILHTIFNDANMVRARFSGTTFMGCSFTNTHMSRIRIESETSMQDCNFTNTHGLDRVNFSHIRFGRSNINNVALRGAIFSRAQISMTKFINTQLDGSDFSFSNCRHSRFQNLQLNNITFAHASLFDIEWTRTTLTNIDFTDADLKKANFMDAAKLENISFSRCQCSEVSFIETRIGHVSFDNALLTYANFSHMKTFGILTFSGIDGLGADFSYSDISSYTFARSQLTDANFLWTGADLANFTYATLNGADFSQASLQYAQITQEQLDSVMSLSSTYFNGRKHRNPNLLMNNGYRCNSTTTINNTFWQVEPRGTTIMITPGDDQICSFTVSKPALMSQLINISRYRRLIERGRAQGHIRTNIWNTSTIVYATTWGADRVYNNHSFRIPERPGFQPLQPALAIPQKQQIYYFLLFFKRQRVDAVISISPYRILTQILHKCCECCQVWFASSYFISDLTINALIPNIFSIVILKINKRYEFVL